MTRLFLFIPAALLLMTTACMPAHVRPAQLMVDAHVLAATGEDVGTMTGYGARVMADWLAVGVSRSSALAHATGRPCGGFGPDPTPCGEQPIVQRDEMTRFTAGYAFSRETARQRLLAIPYVGLGYLEQERVGLHSGARVSGDGGGFLIGGSAGVQYNLFGNLWLGALADAALIMPPEPRCVDCHVPYRDRIGLAGLSLMASWRFPRHER